MDVVIYNINSFGGTYDYSKFLYKAYVNNSKVDKCIMLMPSNADVNEPGIIRILVRDLINSNNKWIKKLHYLYRSLVNPYKLFFFLRKQPAAFVVFNDFDQFTAWLWAPAFKIFKRKHKFAIMLHDPDRDKFFTSKFLSESSMNLIMSFADLGVYHGYLPDKPYYKENLRKVVVPQGIYDDVEIDNDYLNDIRNQAGTSNIIGILGNIRDEKNYLIIIEALSLLDNVKLLISGKVSSSSVSIDDYKRHAKEYNVDNKIIWKVGYVSKAAFNAAIIACDIVLLYYKPTFTSQSAVLNTIAPFNKKFIIADIESSLKQLVDKYSIGKVVPHSNPVLLAEAIKELLPLPENCDRDGWKKYVIDSSWDTNVEITINNYKSL
jgi:glycosyltransferase involved in cell wall biosynthesis